MAIFIVVLCCCCFFFYSATLIILGFFDISTFYCSSKDLVAVVQEGGETAYCILVGECWSCIMAYSALFSRRLNFEVFADLILPAKIAPSKLT